MADIKTKETYSAEKKIDGTTYLVTYERKDSQDWVETKRVVKQK